MRFVLVLALLCASTNIEAISINCVYYTGGFVYIGVVYYCDVATLSVTTEPNQTITSIPGSHLSGHSDASVRGINIMSKTVNYIPHGIANFFPNLDGLQIHICHLKAIEKVDIQSLTNLRELYLGANDLETLKNGLFDSNTALEYLWFDSNKIINVGFDLLKPLSRLTGAFFNGNTCISQQATTAAEIPALRSALNEKCVSSEELRIHYCQKDRDACTIKLKSETDKMVAEIKKLAELHENSKLENKKVKTENANAKSEIKELKLKIEKLDSALNDAKSLLRATNRTLNAVTKHLNNLSENLVQSNVTFN